MFLLANRLRAPECYCRWILVPAILVLHSTQTVPGSCFRFGRRLTRVLTPFTAHSVTGSLVFGISFLRDGGLLVVQKLQMIN